MTCNLPVVVGSLFPSFLPFFSPGGVYETKISTIGVVNGVVLLLSLTNKIRKSIPPIRPFERDRMNAPLKVKLSQAIYQLSAEMKNNGGCSWSPPKKKISGSGGRKDVRRIPFVIPWHQYPKTTIKTPPATARAFGVIIPEKNREKKDDPPHGAAG